MQGEEKNCIHNTQYSQCQKYTGYDIKNMRQTEVYKRVSDEYVILIVWEIQFQHLGSLYLIENWPLPVRCLGW